jgi:mannose-6-phosphate isomerase-like protein (cupin superfamily)
MKRLLPVIVIVAMSAGYVAGIATTWTASAAAQPAAQTQPANWGKIPLAPDQGKPTYWSGDDLKKVHSQLAQRSNGRIVSRPFDLLELPFNRTHYFDIVHRPAATTPPTAEQHEGVTDVYYVIGGSGTVTVGGDIEDRRVVPNRPGEYQGLLRGGQSYKVKSGDVLSVPPNTPHASVGDAGGLTYVLLKINVGLYPWSMVAGVPQ